MIQAHAGHNHRDVRSAMLASRPRIFAYCAHGGTPAHGNDRRRGGADRPVHFLGRVPTRAPAGGTGINCAAAHRRAAAHSPATETATTGSNDAPYHLPGHRGPRPTERSTAVPPRAH